MIIQRHAVIFVASSLSIIRSSFQLRSAEQAVLLNDDTYIVFRGRNHEFRNERPLQQLLGHHANGDITSTETARLHNGRGPLTFINYILNKMFSINGFRWKRLTLTRQHKIFKIKYNLLVLLKVGIKSVQCLQNDVTIIDTKNYSQA